MELSDIEISFRCGAKSAYRRHRYFTDGDSFIIQGRKVRLWDIEAPGKEIEIKK
jgi:hypothetical protein